MERKGDPAPGRMDFCSIRQIMITRRAGREFVPVQEKVDMVNDEGSAVRPVYAAIGVSAVASRPLRQGLQTGIWPSLVSNRQ